MRMPSLPRWMALPAIGALAALPGPSPGPSRPHIPALTALLPALPGLDASPWLHRLAKRLHLPRRSRLASHPTVPAAEASVAAEPHQDAPAPPAGPSSIWTARRVETQGDLWGLGHLSPGGAAEVTRYALPLGLTSAATVLMLGAGAGGPPLALAQELGVWISALEADPVLLALARSRVGREPNALARRVTLGAWNPATPDLAPNAFHHAILLDQIRDESPEHVLAAVTSAVKPRGQLALIETVAAPDLDPDDPALRAWLRLDGRVAPPPIEDAITRTLTRLGYDIRVQEDNTARHIKLAMLGWKAMLRDLPAQRANRAHAAALIVEAEVWMRRIQLLTTQQIRHIRWHAIKTR